MISNNDLKNIYNIQTAASYADAEYVKLRSIHNLVKFGDNKINLKMSAYVIKWNQSDKSQRNEI